MKQLLVSLFLVLAASGCGGQEQTAREGTSTAAGASLVRDVGTIDDLKAAFNAQRGVPRLIVLVSPT